MKRIWILFAIMCIATGTKVTWAQNIEATGFIGGQVNGGVDFSSALVDRIEVQNSVNYGAGLGYLIGDYGGIEFMWSHNKADTLAQFQGGGDRKIFGLNTNQYLGDFVFHFRPRESVLRPFAFFGLGATNLSPDRSNVNSITRFAFAFGGGAKLKLSKRLGARFQAKWSPTYITSTDGGFWCDPFWGGCFSVGNDHYVHELDITGGIIFRF